MDILNQVISLMNKEEVRHFKLFTARTQVEGTRKDLLLFDYIRKAGEDYDEERIFGKLYDEPDKNAFYRLKNRLLGDVNKSLNLQHMEEDDIVFIFHMLSLTRFFINRNKYKVAIHYLRKAEKRAITLENYELLDFIYGEYIKLSHELLTINPEEYIRLRKENREKLRSLGEVDDILAAVIYRLKVSQNFSSDQNPIFDLLEKTVKDFSQNEAVLRNPKFRFTLYHAVSRILLARRDYQPLEQYLLTTYEDFTREGLFTKSTHDSKLQMLVYIVNTLFKNRKTDLSLRYSGLLREAMDEFNGFLSKKYLIFYYNSLVINYRRSNVEKSIEILEKLRDEETFKDSPLYDFFVHANLSASYYNARQYKKAIKMLVQTTIHEAYKSASEEMRMRIAVFELILRMESSDFELVDKRVEKVRKEYQHLLSQPGYSADREVIQIIHLMNRTADMRTDAKLKKAAAAYLNQYQTPDDELPFIDYYQWLKEKVGDMRLDA